MSRFFLFWERISISTFCPLKMIEICLIKYLGAQFIFSIFILLLLLLRYYEGRNLLKTGLSWKSIFLESLITIKCEEIEFDHKNKKNVNKYLIYVWAKKSIQTSRFGPRTSQSESCYLLNGYSDLNSVLTWFIKTCIQAFFVFWTNFYLHVLPIKWPKYIWA